MLGKIGFILLLTAGIASFASQEILQDDFHKSPISNSSQIPSTLRKLTHLDQISIASQGFLLPGLYLTLKSPQWFNRVAPNFKPLLVLNTLALLPYVPHGKKDAFANQLALRGLGISLGAHMGMVMLTNKNVMEFAVNMRSMPYVWSYIALISMGSLGFVNNMAQWTYEFCAHKPKFQIEKDA